MTTETIAKAFGIDPATLSPPVSTVNPKNEPKTESCDCLNDCGDDPALATGKAEYCDHHKQRVAMLAMIERIHWQKPADRLPDADETVMIVTPTHDDPVWLGYYDGTTWITVEGLPLADHAVTAWTPMPRGPQ